MRAGLSFLVEVGLACSFAPPVIDAPRQGQVRAVREEGQDELVVHIDSVPDIATAEMLVGSHVLVDGALINDALVQGIADATLAARAATFAGWTLIDATEGKIGTVLSAEARHEQVLLEVEREDGATALVPLADDLLVAIDPGGGTLTMDCPKGLFDL